MMTPPIYFYAPFFWMQIDQAQQASEHGLGVQGRGDHSNVQNVHLPVGTRSIRIQRVFINASEIGPWFCYLLFSFLKECLAHVSVGILVGWFDAQGLSKVLDGFRQAVLICISETKIVIKAQHEVKLFLQTRPTSEALILEYFNWNKHPHYLFFFITGTYIRMIHGYRH